MTKKLLTFLTLLTLFFGVGWAETYSYSLGKAKPATWSTSTNSAAVTTADGFSFNLVLGGSGTISNALQTSQIRIYQNATFTITPPTGELITEVTFYHAESGNSGTLKVGNEILTYNTIIGNNGGQIWTCSGETELVITASAQCRVNQIDITTTTGGTTPTTYSITGTGATTGGAVTATQTSGITSGTGVTLTASPNSGYELTAFTVNGTDVFDDMTGPDADGAYTYDIIVTADVAVSATFSASGTPTTGTTYERVTSISATDVGKKFVLVYESTPAAMGAISTTSTKYGLSVTDGLTLDGTTLTVQSNDVKALILGGDATNGWTFSLDGNTICWTSGNSLTTGTTGNLWAVSFDGGDAIITNKNDDARRIAYNSASGQQRFATYAYPLASGNTTTKNIQLYREVEATGQYTINKVCDPTAGGSISCSKSSSNGNEEITFSVSTNDNYEFAYVEVKDASNNAVEFTEDANNPGNFSFTMPTSNVTITAHFNQAGTLYILGEANGKFDNADWQPNEGTLMTYSNGKYTARAYFKGYTKYNDGDGYSEFAFTKKLATKDKDNGGWDEINWDGSRYGSGADGSYWGIGGQNQSAFGSTIPLYNHSQKSYRVPAGVYDIEVDLKTYPNTVKVTPVDLSVTLDPASGTFAKGKEIAISSNLTSIVAATGSNETVLIQHKIADGEFVNGSTAILNAVGEDIAVIGKASLGHIVVADTSTYTIENKYSVTVASGITNGTVKVNGANEILAEPGNEVTITATPDSGYSLATLTVTDANNNPVTVTDGMFIMPESNVTVSATFAVNSYGITVVNTNCSVDVASTANYNSQVTFTVTPRSDKYEVSTVTVTYGDNSSKPVTDNGDGTYSFYMPASDVTLTVTCTRKSTGGNQFTLVKNQTDIVAGGEYVILETNEVNAMSYDGSNYDNPSNQFSLSGDVVTLTDGSNVSIFKLDNGSTNGTFTMQDGTRGYVTTPTSTGGKPSLASTGGNWTINYNNGSFEVKGGSLYLRYNADHFRVYTSSTQGRGVKLYKRLAATAGVEIDPVTGDVIGSQTVFVGSNTDGALVQYKVEKQNGNDWDVVTDWTEWTTYTEANGPIEFTITGNVGDVYQVTARAKEAGQEVEPDEEEDFDEQTVQYTFIAPDAPTINPASGSMSSETQNVTITSDYADGIIEYSTDGGATWNTYMGAFHVIVEGVGESVTVQARVTVNGVTSETATATYTRGVQPVVFSPASGTYYDDQTCQMFSTSKNARIYYTTDGSEPSKTNGTLYTDEVSMPATGTYQFKAVAYIGNTASTVSSANYNIRPRSEGTGYNENYLLFNVAELNAMKNSFPSGTYQTDGSYTMVNPVQVVWMSTYKNVTNGYPEYCLIRDNTGYGMIYFGKNNSSHAGYKIFDMGDWISGGYNGKVSLAYSQDHGQLDTHPELGASGSTGKKIYQWPESALSNASVLPEYITIPEILASETPGNIDYWGHYVHLRKNTVQLIASDDPGTYTTGQDKDGKWSGTITDENGNQINYYDKFYLQIDSTWTTTSNFFTGHPNRTFDIYGFVACHLPAEIDYQIAPFAFAWIDQPICDHETGTYTSEQTVKITSPNDPEATIWYKTSEMDDYHVYTGPITVNSTTTIEWYATKQSQYNDVLESKKGEITMTFQEIPVPVITPESEVFAVGSSVDASIAFADGVTVPDGTVIRYTIDGSDPNSADALTYVVGETTLHFTATTTVRAIAELGGIYSAEAESKTYTFVKSNGIVYDLVTNVNQITENGIYVIVNQNYNEAMSNVQGETNRGASGVMFVENTNKGQVYGNDDLAIFTVKEGNHEGEFLFETHNSNVNGFLCVESENNNTLLTEAEMDAMGNDVAVVTIDADGRAHIRYNYSGGDNRYLQYWNRDRYFTTYKTEDADRAVYIYYKNATPLASIEKNGTALPTTNTAENQYTVADQLIAVHYKDAQNNSGNFYLWCKDQGNVSISKTQKTGDDQIDYLKDVTKVQKSDWDQSNWVVLKFTNPADETSLSNAVGKFIKPASITGHYTDGVNYTITMPQYADLTGKVEDENAGFTPNVYCPANFLDANLNIGDGVGPQGAETGDHYFFMNPKVQEVATVTYAVWNGSHFVIPARANGNNQGNFDGAFSVGWDYNAYGDAHSTLLENTVYTFKGVLNTVSTGNGKSAKAGENANAAGTVEGKDVDPQPGKMVYAFDLKGGADSPNIITAIKDVVDVTGKAVAGVKYYNLAGIESDRPFEGVNIIVTTYTDGSRTSTKVLR